MYCQRCAAEVSEDSQFCQACGAATGVPPYPYPYAPAYPQPQQPAKQTNNMALIGLILAFVVPVAGLVVSIIARKQCLERGEDGANLAKAGVIVGAVYCALAFVTVVASLVIPFIMLSPIFDEAISSGLLGLLA